MRFGQYALEQYGFMAKCVLNSWGITRTGDFGEIVYNLIKIGQMRKTKQDRREDFDDVFDFETALVQEFKITTGSREAIVSLTQRRIVLIPFSTKYNHAQIVEQATA